MKEELKKIEEMLKENKLDEALEMMNELIEKEGPNKELLMKRSVILFRLGRKKEALNDVNKAREIDPNDVKVLRGLIDLNAAMGNFDDAKRVLDELEKKAPLEKGVYERKKSLAQIEIVKKESDEYYIKLDNAKKHIKNDELYTAERIFETVSERKDGAYYETGCLLYRKRGMPHRVIELGEDGLKRELLNPRTMRILALSYLDVGRFKDAEKIIDSISEETMGTLMDKSYIKMMNMKYDEAEKILKKMIQINPGEVNLYIRMGDLMARKEGLESALEWYEKALKVNPAESEVYERIANIKGILLKDRALEDRKAFR